MSTNGEPEEVAAIRHVAKYHDVRRDMQLDRRGAMNVVAHIDTLKARLTGVEVEFTDWLDATRKALEAHTEVKANLARVTAADEFARTEWAIWEEKACKLERERKAMEAERDAAREERAACMNEMAKARRTAQDFRGDSELLRCLLAVDAENGGSGLLKRVHERARAAEADRDRLAACVERVREIANQTGRFSGIVSTAAILAALEDA